METNILLIQKKRKKLEKNNWKININKNWFESISNTSKWNLLFKSVSQNYIIGHSDKKSIGWKKNSVCPLCAIEDGSICVNAIMWSVDTIQCVPAWLIDYWLIGSQLYRIDFKMCTFIADKFHLSLSHASLKTHSGWQMACAFSLWIMKKRCAFALFI